MTSQILNQANNKALVQVLNPASHIVNLFSKENITNVPKNKVNINILTLHTALATDQLAQKKLPSALTIFVVLSLHALAIYLLSTHKPIEKIEVKAAKPMMVSLIAPPSPEPEIVPIIEPLNPEPKPVVKDRPKPKKVIEKIKPIEKPVERLVEATTEFIQDPLKEEITKPEAGPILAAETMKEMPKAVPVVEDKYEEPRFGVAYLNNPAPEYPAMSRRQGEEGRVLMMVLVSAGGGAEDVQIEKSSGSDWLDNAAVAAVKRWRFIPAKKNNQPLSAYVLVPMKFSLDS